MVNNRNNKLQIIVKIIELVPCIEPLFIVQL